MGNCMKTPTIGIHPLRGVLELAGTQETIAFYRSIVSSFDQKTWAFVRDDKNQDNDFVRGLEEIFTLVKWVGEKTFHNEITKLLWGYHQRRGGGSPEYLFSDIETRRLLWSTPQIDGRMLAVAEEAVAQKRIMSVEELWWEWWIQVDELIEQEVCQGGKRSTRKQTARVKRVETYIESRRRQGEALKRIMSDD